MPCATKRNRRSLRVLQKYHSSLKPARPIEPRIMSDPSGNVATVIKGARFTEADAEAHIRGICFKTGPPQRVGVELEGLGRGPRGPAAPAPAGRGGGARAPLG